MGALIGTLIGAAIEGLTAIIKGSAQRRASRKDIADALRDTADKVERGDLVSDEAIDALKETTDEIRDLLDRSD